MRNLKRALSLVLASVMVLGLMIVGTSAMTADFPDAADVDEQYSEAIDVLSTIGYLEGNENGDLMPDEILTRAMAAKFLTVMRIGMDNAEKLGLYVKTFDDVAPGSWAAGYIGYCKEMNIIAGDGTGKFNPDGQLTAVQFGKMLLVALGYDPAIEGYVSKDDSWRIKVAASMDAAEIDLDGVSYDDPLTREQAAQMILNTIKAPMVEYTNRTQVSVNGADIVVGSSSASYVTTTIANAQHISNRLLTNSDGKNHNGGYTVEFGEKYIEKLELTSDETDEFERPAHTWIYDSKKIDTYVDYGLMVNEYKTTAKYGDIYNDIGISAVRNYEKTAYVDGNINTNFDKDKITRNSKEDVSGTGTGVLTQVFVKHTDDPDVGEVIVTSINTYLAKANNNYNEQRETASLTVFETDYNGKSKTVDVDDVPEVKGVVEDQFYLVRMSGKDNNGTLEVVDLYDVEVKENSAITKFTQNNASAGNGYVTKLTTEGHEYSRNAKAYYDDDVLDTYDQQLMVDKTYNVYLDLYGNFIGVDVYSGTDNYVFITGYDLNSSNLTIKTADAAAIFTDGTMQAIKVNVKDTNENIEAINKNGSVVYSLDPGYYFTKWTNNTVGCISDGNHGGNRQLNRWYTYTVDDAGVYTLKPATRMFATSNSDIMGYSSTTGESTINASSVRLDSTTEPHAGAVNHTGDVRRAWGEDDSIFITVDIDKVSTSGNTGKDIDAITEVTGVYTGVQDVDIKIEDADQGDNMAHSVYTVYDKNNYIIASIVIGEAIGGAGNYAFILSDVKSERIDDNSVHYWDFDAVVNGEIKTLTAMSKYPSTITALRQYHMQELRYTGDYVTGIKDIKTNDIYTTGVKTGSQINGEAVYDIGHVNSGDYHDVTKKNHSTGNDPLAAETKRLLVVEGASTGQREGKLEIQGRTLSAGNNDLGLTFVRNAKTVLIQKINNEWKNVPYDDIAQAVSDLADYDGVSRNGLQFSGRIVAALNSTGVAEWAVIISDTPVNSGSNTPSVGGGKNYTYTANIFSNGMARLAVNVNRPDYISYSHKDSNNYTWSGAKLGYKFDVLINGVKYDTVEYGNVNSSYQAIPANATTTQVVWTNANGAFWMPLDADDIITIDNFQWTNMNDQYYIVKYKDKDNSEMAYTDFDTPNTNTEFTVKAVSGDLKFGLSSTKWTSSSAFSYSTIGLATDLNKTGHVGTNVLESSVSVATNRADYVYVTVDTSNTTKQPIKYTITGDTSVANIINTGAQIGGNFDKITASYNDKIKIVPTESTVTSGNGVKFKIDITNEGSSAYAYNVKLTVEGKTIFNDIVKVGGSASSSAIYLTKDLVISDSNVDISVVAEKQELDNASISANGRTVTLTFKETVSFAPGTTLNNAISFTDNGSSPNSIDTDTMSYHGKTITINFLKPLQENDEIKINRNIVTGAGYDDNIISSDVTKTVASGNVTFNP